MRELAFVVIGHLSRRSGLGVAARNLVSQLVKHGISVRTIDVSPNGPETQHVNLAIDLASVPRDAVTVTVLGMNDAVNCFLERGDVYKNQILNVGYFWWELLHVPPAWKMGLQLFDAHLAGSRFLENALQTAAPSIPIIPILQTLDPGKATDGIREHLSIPRDKFVFLTTFDPISEPNRKNPLGAIDAFKRSTSVQDSILIVRANIPTIDKSPPIIEAVKNRIKDDHRIIFIENSLSYAEVLGLIKEVDVLISLHRSEGLGLPLLEAMVYGKPVVATGWSGNMDFMDNDSALLVDSKLVPVDGQYEVYKLPSIRKRACWAEPSIEHASELITRIAADNELYGKLSAAASVRSTQYIRKAEKAMFIGELTRLSMRSNYVCQVERAGLSTKDLNRLRDIQLSQKFEGLELIRHILRREFDRHIGWRTHGNTK